MVSKQRLWCVHRAFACMRLAWWRVKCARRARGSAAGSWVSEVAADVLRHVRCVLAARKVLDRSYME